MLSNKNLKTWYPSNAFKISINFIFCWSNCHYFLLCNFFRIKALFVHAISFKIQVFFFHFTYICVYTVEWDWFELVCVLDNKNNKKKRSFLKKKKTKRVWVLNVMSSAVMCKINITIILPSYYPYKATHKHTHIHTRNWIRRVFHLMHSGNIRLNVIQKEKTTQ